jgi:hypothetical protein
VLVPGLDLLPLLGHNHWDGCFPKLYRAYDRYFRADFFFGYNRWNGISGLFGVDENPDSQFSSRAGQALL